jgi:hypothetical protein
MARDLPTLAVMNKWLEKFGKPTEACRYRAMKSLGKIHVNIYDLRAGRIGPTFRTIQELSVYCKMQHKLFPRHAISRDFKPFQKNFISEF